MVGGRMRCIGSPQHLKQRFGSGFTIEMKLDVPSESEVSHMLDMYDLPTMVTAANLEAVCKTLGDLDRVELLAQGRTFISFSISSSLENSPEGVQIAQFLSWWYSVDRVDKINEFLEDRFEDADLVEEQDTKLRYKIGISEYAVSQTTLEQIFNTF